MTHTPLTKSQAELLTAKAVTTADALAHLLKQLHDGQAHKALGYATWTAYCAAHFDESLRTIQRYIRQERAREALAGCDSLSRLTGAALETLATMPSEIMRYVADVAAQTTTKRVGEESVRAVQLAIHDTLTLNAVELADGSQVPVKDALADGVRGVLREDVLKGREYIVANQPVVLQNAFSYGNEATSVLVWFNRPDKEIYEQLFANAGTSLRISIWREQPNG
jgi:hypothetical protein